MASVAADWAEPETRSKSESVAPVKKPVKLHALAAQAVSASEFEAAVIKCWQTYHSLDMCDGDDQTPLHKACARGQMANVKLLVSGVPRHSVVGADVNAADALGRTPLMLAAQVGHSEMVRFLLDHKADPKQHDNEKRSAVHYASTDGVKQLLAIDGGGGSCRGCSKGCTLM